MNLLPANVWNAIVSWDNFWFDFGGAPFVARTFPG